MITIDKKEGKIVNLKGQGALEYLLLIGGAVLIAAIVITLVIGTGSTGVTAAERQAGEALCLQNSTTITACNNASASAKLTAAGMDCNWYPAAATCKLCTKTGALCAADADFAISPT